MYQSCVTCGSKFLLQCSLGISIFYYRCSSGVVGYFWGWALTVYREIKIHVYGKRQMADLSWESLRIENKQIKTVQNNSYGKNWRETTYFWVEVINS